MLAAIDALSNADPPYIEVGLAGGWGEWQAGGSVRRVGERTRRVLGTWPTAEGMADAIVAALRQAAERSQPEERSKLQAAADALAGFARDVLVEVTARKIGG